MADSRSLDDSIEFSLDFERRAVKIGEALLGNAYSLLRSKELWELVGSSDPNEGTSSPGPFN
jgi:hypothetical protein